MANGFINKSLPDLDELSACLDVASKILFIVIMVVVVDMVTTTLLFTMIIMKIYVHVCLSIPGFGSSCTYLDRSVSK